MTTPMQSHPATLTAKMQLTLPKALCQRMGIVRGDRLTLTVEEGSIILTPLGTPIDAAAKSIESEKPAR